MYGLLISYLECLLSKLLLVSPIVVFCILFITCVSIVIVLHSLYRAAVSALLSLVVLLIMLCKLYVAHCLSK